MEVNNNNTAAAAYDLIYLVGCSVNGQAPDKQKCAEMNLDAVFQMARRHSLTVAAALALEQTMPLPAYFTEEKFKAIRRLSLFDTERAQLLAAMEKSGIWYMPLKGIVIRDCYPQPEMREMSDNDILFDESKANEVRQIMENAGYTCTLFEKTHHDVYKKGMFLGFEWHRALFSEHTPPLLINYGQKIRQKMLRDAGNSFGYHLSDEDFYILLICQIFRDYQSGGTGIRALLDVYVFNRVKGSGLNRRYVHAALQSLRLDVFEDEIKLLAEKLFSMQPLSSGEKEEATFFIESNSHGTMENRLAKVLGNNDSRRAKRQYALTRIFPSRDNIKKHHPVVDRHKALYPLLVIYRPFKGMIKHRKQMKAEIKRLRDFKTIESRGKFNEEAKSGKK